MVSQEGPWLQAARAPLRAPSSATLPFAAARVLRAVYAWFSDAQHVWLVLEYCEGGDLFKLMANHGGRLDEHYVCVEVGELEAGSSHASHSAGGTLQRPTGSHMPSWIMECTCS